jgi:hypothetical protein
MNDSILVLGAGETLVDVTPYICYDSFTVSEKPVYDESTTFTNVLGDTNRQYLGVSVDISVTLRGVPAVAPSGDNSPPSAGEIFAVLDAVDPAEKLDVTYVFPVVRTGKFERPAVSTTIAVEGESNREYDITMSLHCPLIPLDGL